MGLLKDDLIDLKEFIVELINALASLKKWHNIIKSLKSTNI